MPSNPLARFVVPKLRVEKVSSLWIQLYSTLTYPLSGFVAVTGQSLRNLYF